MVFNFTIMVICEIIVSITFDWPRYRDDRKPVVGYA